MKRDTAALKNGLFDIAVIGGGVHGAAAVRHLALAGYRSVLIEKNDFCSATSANSLKILHGGLRYLQHGDFRRMRESIRSRRDFMQLAPHLVRPLPCLVPTKGFGLKSRMVMVMAFKINDLISFDRNRGLSPEKQLGRGRILKKNEAISILKGLGSDAMKGAGLWYDALIEDSERMVIVLLEQASQAGAQMANYMEAVELSDPTKGDGYHTVKVRDKIDNERFAIRAKMVVDCGGPWLGEFLGSKTEYNQEIGLAKAINIVVKKIFFGKYAVGLDGTSEHQDKDALVKRCKRLFFFVPWRNATMIGTTYTYWPSGKKDLVITSDDIQEILDEINQIYPSAKLNAGDVLFSHAGLVPAHQPKKSNGNSDPRLLKHSKIIDHDSRGRSGVVAIRGVKYTTALVVAEQLESLLRNKGLRPTASTNAQAEKKTAISENDINNLQKKHPHLFRRYGKDCEKLYRIILSEPSGCKVVASGWPLLHGEILHMIRNEMAFHLCDLVLFRSGLGTCGRPEKKDVDRVASVMAGELGWDNSLISEEIDILEKQYELKMI